MNYTVIPSCFLDCTVLKNQNGQALRLPRIESIIFRYDRDLAMRLFTGALRDYIRVIA